MPLSQDSEDVPHTSPTITFHKRQILRPPPTLHPELAQRTLATAPATGVVASALIPTSRVSHLLVGSILRAIDERRPQVVCPHSLEGWGLTGANTSEYGDEKRFLEMCFVRFFSIPDPLRVMCGESCPPASE